MDTGSSNQEVTGPNGKRFWRHSGANTWLEWVRERREGMNKFLADFCPKRRRGKCGKNGSFIAGRKGSMCCVPADGDDPAERGQSWVTGTGRESTGLYWLRMVHQRYRREGRVLGPRGRAWERWKFSSEGCNSVHLICLSEACPVGSYPCAHPLSELFS